MGPGPLLGGRSNAVRCGLIHPVRRRMAEADATRGPEKSGGGGPCRAVRRTRRAETARHPGERRAGAQKKIMI